MLNSESIEENGETDSMNVFIPEQSENCLLGEKIVAYKDSLNKENKLIQIPVWRKDNFNQNDSVHISDIPSLYSNYKIELIEENLVLIQTKKLYDEAKTFTRFIKFDSEGFQMYDITFYDKKMGQIEFIKGAYILILENPSVSTDAYQLKNVDDYAPSFYKLTSKLKVEKIIIEPKKGMYRSLIEMNKTNPGLSIKFQVIEGCNGCQDSFWSYQVFLDDSYKFVSTEVIGKGVGEYYFYNQEKLDSIERLVW